MMRTCKLIATFTPIYSITYSRRKVLSETICQKLGKQRLTKLVEYLKDNYSVFMEEEEEKGAQQSEAIDDPKNPLKIPQRFVNFKISEIEKKQFEQIEKFVGSLINKVLDTPQP